MVQGKKRVNEKERTKKKLGGNGVRTDRAILSLRCAVVIKTTHQPRIGKPTGKEQVGVTSQAALENNEDITKEPNGESGVRRRNQREMKKTRGCGTTVWEL